MDKREGWRNNNEFCLKVGFGHQPMGMKALLLSKRMIIETSLFGCSLCINHAAQHTAIYWPNVLNGSRVVNPDREYRSFHFIFLFSIVHTRRRRRRK